MDDFVYHDGQLHAESVPVERLAKEHGTPLWVYSKQTLLAHYRRIDEAFSPLRATICYAIKSCQNLAICRLLREAGAAFDVVSGGEILRVIEVGADPKRVVFAGVGKSDDEIRLALKTGIGWFNVESEEELANLADIAAKMGTTARVALRVNPDVDPHTHAYTTTGKRETKFGVDWQKARGVFQRFSKRQSISLHGIHLHLGSQVRTVDPYVEAIVRALSLIAELRSVGANIRAINLGGGFGAHYDGVEALPAADYANRIVPLLIDCGLDVLFEPGRSISANAGILLTRILYTKSSGTRRFIIVDAAMNDLIRPALYGAFHFVWPAKVSPHMETTQRIATLDLPGCETVDIVGPVCESGDFLAKDRSLPPLHRGDLLAVFTAGAYGMAMSSQYNSRPRAAEVLVEGSDFRLIRRRETYEDLVATERI
ncbi:MAG: diaminopimelate decarboxylase [Planctomycetota bacterium]